MYVEALRLGAAVVIWQLGVVHCSGVPAYLQSAVFTAKPGALIYTVSPLNDFENAGLAWFD